MGKVFKKLRRKAKNIKNKAVDAVKDVGSEIKDVGKGVKKVSKTVGKGVKKAAKATGSEIKDTGKDIRRVSKKVGKGVKKGARTVGSEIKDTGKDVRRVSKKVGKGVKKGARTVGSEIKDTGKDVRRVSKKVGKGVKKGAKATGSEIKDAGKFVGKKTKKGAIKVGRVAKKTTVKVGKKIKEEAGDAKDFIVDTAEKVLNISDFKLKTHFIICYDKASFPDADVKKWIERRLKLAEKIFSMKPALKMSYSFERHKNGNKMLNKRFTKGASYNRFMNKHFDNMSKGIIKGKLVFLVAEGWAVSNKTFKKGEMINLCGKALFPLYPGWKKHAIYLSRNCGTDTFAHELGHVFSLRHTFEKGGLCCADYKKGEKGKSSTYKNGKMNLMDYKTNLTSTEETIVRRESLNKCQRRAAALGRRRYMLITGHTNYLKLKGLV